MSIDESVADRIRAQNEQTMRDLPSRFVSISMTALLATWFLPGAFTAAFYAVYLVQEFIGVVLVRRLEREVTRGWAVTLLIAATLGASLVAALMASLWWAPGVAPKVASFAGLATALIHCIMVRSTWMPFGIVTAVPLGCGFVFSVIAYLFQTSDRTDALVGTALIAVMLIYLMRGMIGMHATRSELLCASHRAEEGNRAKSRFLAAMSHEIRTPLNAICGMSQLLREDPDPDEIENRAALLLKASNSLRAIVDDVLDHAKVEAGRFELRLAPADIAEEVTSVVEMFRGPAEEKGLTLATSIADGLPRALNCDALRLRQVVSNLVSNAVKFSDRGRIDVRLFAEPAGEFWTVTVAVSDQGPGLSTAETGRLFKDFSRIERDDRPTIAGTGLGLSIARGFARLMGGDITVRSAPGEGATFTFRFLARLADQPAEPAPIAATALVGEALQGIDSILLVDDTASNRYVVRAFLRRYDVEIVEVENGRQALDALAERAFSIILLDMHMPVLDGRATFDEMRRIGGHMAGIPVIALTADAAPEDRDRYLDHGFVGYIAKPVQRADLIAEIARVTKRQESAAA